MDSVSLIPTKWVGPIKISGKELNESLEIPLTTFEKPLWFTVNRGAKISRLVENGISTIIIKDQMSRSILLEAPTSEQAYSILAEIQENDYAEIIKIGNASSRFIEFQECRSQIVGSMLFMRFSFKTGEASGHNMVTKAADDITSWLVTTYPSLRYISVSANYCVDKKVSAINGILGRGKYVIAEILIPESICIQHLKTTPQKIVEINTKKNLVGSIIAGSIHSANAHYANMLLALYLATGQDGANIVEGSQGITFAELRDNQLYFSVTLPNIIVGSLGSGKDLEFVQTNLEKLGCLPANAPNNNARKLAVIAAATVLCGELSLLAALTNQGELMHAHVKIERIKQ